MGSGKVAEDRGSTNPGKFPSGKSERGEGFDKKGKL
jgi:hypothetical protein